MKIAIYSHSIAPSIDGVCRRFTSIIHELVRQGHELILFTLEEKPEDLPPLSDVVMLDYFFMPAYPNKRVAKPSFRNMFVITQTLLKHRPHLAHVTADGIAQMFALAGLVSNVPVVGSFHTDLLDLVSTHHANFFQKWCITFKEHVDSLVLDSCATTSKSFAVLRRCFYIVLTISRKNSRGRACPRSTLSSLELTPNYFIPTKQKGERTSYTVL